MKIFLTGATGFVGGHMRATLLEQGYTIRLLVHKRNRGFESEIEQVEGDVTKLETFATALDGCDTTINLVGIIREFPGRGVTFEKLHVEATRNVLEACQRAGIKRYLHMSALGTRPGATSQYHQTKYRAEELVCTSGMKYTIFRPSLIFGPKDAFVNLLAGYIKNLPVVPVIGDGKYRLQPISAEDVVRCFVMSLEMPETIGNTYELCGPDRLSYDEMLDTIGRVVGKNNVNKIHNPLGVMKLIVPLLQGFSLFPLTMDQITMLVEENICDSTWRDTFQIEPLRFINGISSYLQT